MNLKIPFVLLLALLAGNLLLITGCPAPVGASATTTITPPAGVIDTSKVGFESTQVADLVTASGLLGNWGDYNNTWNDTATAVSNDMSFAVDASKFDTGAASLKISATARQNRYGPGAVAGSGGTQAGWTAVLDLTKVVGLTTPLDLTGKTLSIKALVPTGSGITGIKLVFKTATDQSQGKVVVISIKDSWTSVTYLFGGPTDYTSAGFDITQVTGLSISAVVDPAAANVSGAIAFVDSVSW